MFNLLVPAVTTLLDKLIPDPKAKAEVKAHLNPPKTQQEIDEEAFAEWVIKKKADEEAKLRAEYEASK